MKIMAVADLHGISTEDLNKILSYDKERFDVVVTLGDIRKDHLEEIKEAFKGKKIVGLEGNHDKYGTLSSVGIYNINNKQVEISGVTMVGIGGALKYDVVYKNKHLYPTYNQEVIVEICSKLPKSDIILGHNSPYGIHDSDKMGCEGFIGITNYVVREKPKYCIHGHQHMNKTTWLFGTNVISVYGAVIVDTETGEIEEVFKIEK